MSAASYLANYGITVQQAYDWIFDHIDDPGLIFQTAEGYGITTSMFSEIVGYPVSTINNYFESRGFDPHQLDNYSYNPKDWIFNHVDNPGLIFYTAKEYGTTTSMLSEIVGYPVSTVNTYFESHGFDSSQLDNYPQIDNYPQYPESSANFVTQESAEDSFTLTADKPWHLSTSNYIDLAQATEITTFTAGEYGGIRFWALDSENAQNLLDGNSFQGYVIADNEYGLGHITLPAGRWWIGATYNGTLSENQSVRGFDEVSVVSLPGESFISNVPMQVGGNAGAWAYQGFQISGSPHAYIETEGTGGEFMLMTPDQLNDFAKAYQSGFTGGSYSYIYALGENSGGPATEIEGELNLPDGEYYLTWINTTNDWQGGAGNIWIYS
jgi:hypothetical protein